LRTFVTNFFVGGFKVQSLTLFFAHFVPIFLFLGFKVQSLTLDFAHVCY